MSRDYEQHCVGVVCPFFVGKNRSRIICEGQSAGNLLSISFSNPADCANWVKQNCNSFAPKCIIEESLKRKWEDMER